MIKLKNRDQIERIRESCQLLSQMFKALVPLVQEGITTLELDAFAEAFIRKHQGKPAFKGYMGFPGTLCTSVNHEVIHGIPKGRKLQKGDLVGIDCGIDLKGYFSDMAFTVPVGTITPEEEKLLQVTRESLYAGIGAVMPGSRIRDVSKAISSVIKPHRYGIVTQYCGHGVGFSQHEDPQVPNYLSHEPSPRIAPGMVLAIEPMVNLGVEGVRVLSDDWTVVTLDGKKSAHFEHTVAVFEDHAEKLTAFPDEPL